MHLDSSVTPSTPASARSAGRRPGPLTLIAAGSIVVGALLTALVPVVLPGAAEHTTTGAILLALAAGWGLLATLTSRLSTQPQRWARVPAIAFGVTGIGVIMLAPDDAALQTAGYAWPPVLLALTGWMLLQLRRAMRSRARWLLYPVLVLLALASVGGLLQTVAERELRTEDAPGELITLPSGRRMHLACEGSGSPTVVLHNGLGGNSANWARVLEATAVTTRVCAYDRAGQGWSDAAGQPQDSAAVVADLHQLLDQADERGPFVMAGHSSGGAYAMAYAAEHPHDVAGLVLLDSMTPRQFTDLPDFPRVHDLTRRLYGVAPTLTRIGAGQLVRALFTPDLPAPAGEQALAVAASPRGWRTTRDEHSVYRRALAQAGELTTLGDKPVVVVSTTHSLEGTSGWKAAQAELMALSGNSTSRIVDSTHADVIVAESAALQSADAVLDTVDRVRTGVPLAVGTTS